MRLRQVPRLTLVHLILRRLRDLRVRVAEGEHARRSAGAVDVLVAVLVPDEDAAPVAHPRSAQTHRRHHRLHHFLLQRDARRRLGRRHDVPSGAGEPLLGRAARLRHLGSLVAGALR